MKMKQILLEIDQFGSVFNIPVQGHSPVYKTLFGGIMRLLYLLYLSFLLFNGNFQPQISTSKEIILETLSYKFETSPIAISFFSYSGVQFINLLIIQRQDKNKIFFIPFLLNYKSDQLIGQQMLLKNFCSNNSGVKQTNYYDDFYCINTNETYFLTRDPIIPTNQIYSFLYLLRCSEHLLTGEQYCATEEEFQQYIRTAYVRMTIFVQQYNIKTKVIETFGKDDYIPISFSGIGMNIQYQISNINIDDNFFVQQYTQEQIISDANYYSYQFRPEDSQTNRKLPTLPFFEILLTVMTHQNKIYIVYKKINQVLAEFSSVFNVLLFFGIIANLISKKQMMSQIQNSIIINSENDNNKNLEKRIFSQLNIIQIYNQIAMLEYFKKLTLSPSENLFMVQLKNYFLKKSKELIKNNGRFRRRRNGEGSISELNQLENSYADQGAKINEQRKENYLDQQTLNEINFDPLQLLGIGNQTIFIERLKSSLLN